MGGGLVVWTRFDLLFKHLLSYYLILHGHLRNELHNVRIDSDALSFEDVGRVRCLRLLHRRLPVQVNLILFFSFDQFRLLFWLILDRRLKCSKSNGLWSYLLQPCRRRSHRILVRRENIICLVLINLIG